MFERVIRMIPVKLSTTDHRTDLHLPTFLLCSLTLQMGQSVQTPGLTTDTPTLLPPGNFWGDADGSWFRNIWIFFRRKCVRACVCVCTYRQSTARVGTSAQSPLTSPEPKDQDEESLQTWSARRQHGRAAGRAEIQLHIFPRFFSWFFNNVYLKTFKEKNKSSQMKRKHIQQKKKIKRKWRKLKKIKMIRREDES